MKSSLLGFLVTFQLVPCLTTASDTPPPVDAQLPMSVSVDEGLFKTAPECVAGAWTGYGLARANRIAEEYVPGKPFDAKSVETFALEVESRGSLAQIWAELKESAPACKNKYLDQLLAVRDAGFLSEYVWLHLRSENWKAEPTGLRRAEFDAWARKHLKAHHVETHAWVEVGEPGGK